MTEPITVPRPLATAASWSWRLLIVLTGLAVAALILSKLLVVWVPLVLALFLASVLEPLTSRLRARRWPPALAAAVVFLTFLLVVVGGLSWIGNSVAGEFDQVDESVREGTVEIDRFLQGPPLNLSAARIDALQDQVRTALASSGEGVAGRLAGGARQASEVVGGLLLMLFVLFFFLKDGAFITHWFLDRTPVYYRDEAREIGRRARFIMRQYLAATAATGLINAVFIGVALAVLGVPLVLPLAVLTFFGGFFPLIGATVAGAVAALVALVDGGFGPALAVLAVTIVVQQVEGNLLQPLILERAVKLHAIITVLAVAGGLVLFGLLGAFLSVPIVAFVSQVANYYRVRRLEQLEPVVDPDPDYENSPQPERIQVDAGQAVAPVAVEGEPPAHPVP
ncbi:MAG: UPF0118 membrane protein SCO0513 [uncultured Acidimicrobiales bacterium]|uniref:UPF0118 membrane protein SCO0513 n=1 Tax=uncultured Acidimicrobiales bacterium TaxID=310071 RepID=A0A6J4HZG3_9ACTN|nr:MAG: UPF0118 membrane protein SCO0513 [uncultured Acidimicrobiales bacterium]